MKDKVFHVISNTHWDREWRFPFQQNRQMLVDMIDKVIDILEKKPEYRAFHLDSQSIVLEDYLEIKPHMEYRIKKLIKSKRLFVGPWYILPEEFQVGGENLIRNLLLGHKISNKYGGVSKIGYSPFSWGQISQLPQIYSQFDISLIMFYRGVNSLDSPKAEFIWEGADGTRSITSRFSTMPRYNFYFYIYRPIVFNETPADIEYKWTKNTRPFHYSDTEQVNEDYSILSPGEEYFPEIIIEQVNKIIADQAKDFTTQHAIWMEGHDSSGPNPITIRIIKDIKKMMPDVNVIHSTLEDYANLIYKNAKTNKLSLVKGERRSAQFDKRSGNLYGYTTSARMYLKQMNFNAERWIQFYAEPFNIFSGLLGRDINDLYPEIAWDLIIQNSAHDSIGGCSLDEIHEDMVNRYKQSIEISKGIFSRACSYIVKNINTTYLSSNNPENDIFLLAFNPNQYERNEVVNAFIDIPKELDLGSIEIIDKQQAKLETTIIEKSQVQPVVEQMINRPMYFNMVRYKVRIALEKIPAFGYKAFRVIPIKNKNESKKTNIARIVKQNVILENGSIKLKVNSNGTINITEKVTKLHFKNLAYFADEGEAGHAWVNKKVEPFITSLKSIPKIKILENNNLSATCEISHALKIPKNKAERLKKNPKSATINIKMFITLKKDSANTEIIIKVENNAESHRLRIMFPTNINTKYSYGEGQFDVVERKIERINSENWIEQPMYDYPMHHFVDVSNSREGFAVLVDGLKEYEVLNDKKNTLAVTLFRGFEYIIEPSSKRDFTHQKGSQCLGKSEYRMTLFPHSGNWQKGNVYKEALNFNNTIRMVQTGSGKGILELEHSFMNISNEKIILGTIKKPENDYKNNAVIRLYNPTTNSQRTTIAFSTKIKSVEIVSLEEKRIEVLQVKVDNSVDLEFGKKKIITLKIFFNKKY